jgi:hypothetical protein
VDRLHGPATIEIVTLVTKAIPQNESPGIPDQQTLAAIEATVHGSGRADLLAAFHSFSSEPDE